MCFRDVLFVALLSSGFLVTFHHGFVCCGSLFLVSFCIL